MVCETKERGKKECEECADMWNDKQQKGLEEYRVRISLQSRKKTKKNSKEERNLKKKQRKTKEKIKYSYVYWNFIHFQCF